MEKRMPFYTDDRTILITAEFWENGYLLRNGKSCIQRFELDLILRDDTTLDQLLDALHHGIENWLQTKYDLTPSEEDAAFLYEDHYVHDPAGNILDEFSEYDEAEVADGMPLAQHTMNSWLICWKLFRECSREYIRGYAETQAEPTRAAVFPPQMPRHPVIACGSIDLNAWSPKEVLSISNKSQIWLDQKRHGSKTLRELGFVSSSRLIFDPAMWHRSDVLFDDAVSNYRLHWPSPVYQAGTQALIDFDGSEVHIVAPAEPSKPHYAAMIPAILSPLLMTGAFIGIGSIVGPGLTAQLAWLLAGTLIAATTVCGLIAWAVQRRAYRMELKLSCTDYENYIRKTLAYIRERQEQNAALMRKRYPPVLDRVTGKDLVHMAQSASGDVFSRSKDHPDFLRARIGLSCEGTVLVPNRFPICGEIRSQHYSGLRYRNIENHFAYPFTILPPVSSLRGAGNAQQSAKYLSDLPADIARHYGFLNHAPVLLDIGNSQAIGVLLPDSQVTPRPFIANLMLDLCFHHSPEDIQILIFLKETADLRSQQEAIRLYKHLPHCRKLLRDISSFAFDELQARRIMDRVYQQLKATPRGKRPHVLLIMEQEYGLHHHPLSEFLPTSEAETRSNPLGITFLCCNHVQLALPKFCAYVVKATAGAEWFLLPFRQLYADGSDSRYAFRPDDLPYRFSNVGMQDEVNPYFRAFKTISALSCKRFGHNDSIPMTDYFQLLEEYSALRGFPVKLTFPAGMPEEARRSRRDAELKRYMQEIEKRGSVGGNTPLNSLAVPIGRSSGGTTMLDLFAGVGGPHALVFSDPGMGKTELLVTYLHSLCIHHRPSQVKVVPVDINSGGLEAQIGHLPHVVPLNPHAAGGHQSRASDIAQRLVSLLDQEISQRNQLLSQLNVSSIDAFNHALKDLRHHALYRLRMTPENTELWLNQVSRNKPVPHLFVIINHFHQMQTLLAAEQRFLNLIDTLSQLMRKGTQLGIHLVLATEKLDPDMDRTFLSGFQTRICLKTADTAAAAAVAGVTLPAETFFPGDGRACLWCEAPPRIEHFQTSICAFDGFANPVRITLAVPNGYYELFYDSQLKPPAPSPSKPASAPQPEKERGHAGKNKPRDHYDSWLRGSHAGNYAGSASSKDAWPKGYQPGNDTGGASSKDAWPKGYQPGNDIGGASSKDAWPKGYQPGNDTGGASSKDAWPKGYQPDRQ